MVTRIGLFLLPSVTAMFLGIFLLGASPSERADWQGVNPHRVLFFRSCWGVAAALSVVSAGMLILWRPSVPLAVRLYAAAVVLATVLLLVAVIEPYFQWSTI